MKIYFDNSATPYVGTIVGVFVVPAMMFQYSSQIKLPIGFRGKKRSDSYELCKYERVHLSQNILRESQKMLRLCRQSQENRQPAVLPVSK